MATWGRSMGRTVKISLLLLSVFISAAGAGEVFVSPAGDDVDADGSEERPFLRVQAAIDNAWDYDVIVLVPGRHVSDGEIRFRRRKLTVRAQHAPLTRTGGCWPIHTADPSLPTLTRCNITSWPQAFSVPSGGEQRAWDSPATSGQGPPVSFVDAGLGDSEFHGTTRHPIPSSEGGDYADPGDAPRGNPEDWTCGPLGCSLAFHGNGNLQAGVNSNTTLVGARFLLLQGDEIIIRDLDIRGAPEKRKAGSGGCLFANGRSHVTVVDSAFSFCKATAGGGAVTLGYGARAVLAGVRFLNNTGGQRGGAVLIQGEEGAARFSSCEFSGNYAQEGGALYLMDEVVPVLQGCDFYANTATRGGAVFATGESGPSISDSAFLHHSAQDGGAVLVAGDARVFLSACTMHNNTARARGGAVMVEDRALAAADSERAALQLRGARGGGAVFAIAPAMIEMASCALGRNSAQKGAAHIDPPSLGRSVRLGLGAIGLETIGLGAIGDLGAVSEKGSNGTALPAGVFGNRSGLTNGSNTVCNGRGTVKEAQPLLCECALPWVGADSECSVRCLGYNSADGSMCSGHGECDVPSAQLDRDAVGLGGGDGCASTSVLRRADATSPSLGLLAISSAQGRARFRAPGA
eukprot:CAMPEP_0180391442 /NCGR_PEP_ID=MMETSP0989-20121125/32580_1 /TAXON_ID=697907 /ORGANISM="non described non described, Strain CCMP2293" /LENGTH=632 /DNA_ID=CAMNT_0022392983 /DNA_START=43 /DNA_END=1938 /DNA_ORIENTATION=-